VVNVQAEIVGIFH